MKMNSSIRCQGVKPTNVTVEGKTYNNTKFYLVVDLAPTQDGEGFGTETRPFTFGDCTEYKKWEHLSKSIPDGGIPCDAVFDVITASEGKTKLVLLDIKPAKLASSPKV